MPFHALQGAAALLLLGVRSHKNIVKFFPHEARSRPWRCACCLLLQAQAGPQGLLRLVDQIRLVASCDVPARSLALCLINPCRRLLAGQHDACCTTTDDAAVLSSSGDLTLSRVLNRMQQIQTRCNDREGTVYLTQHIALSLSLSRAPSRIWTYATLQA